MVALKKVDWLLLTAAILLNSFGLVAIFSLDRGQSSTEYPFFYRQLFAAGIGLLCVFAAFRFQYTLFRSLSTSLYILSLVLLVGVLMFGETIRGTQGWFVVGGFSFQPVEFAKIALTLHLAHFFARNRDHFRTWWPFIGSGIIVSLPVLLTVLQPDAGSALMMCALWLVMILVAGVRRVHVLSFVIAGTIFSLVAWFFLLADFQKDRIRTFFDPTGDPLGRGYNVAQSIIAVGSGGMWGKGLGYGSQSQLRFLPEARTDFIFAAIGEELGFVGVATMIILLGLIWYRVLHIAHHAVDDFGLFVVVGFFTLSLVQTMVNVGMNIGLLPVTGIVFPFVSYGGSALLFVYVLLGIVLLIGTSAHSKGFRIIE